MLAAWRRERRSALLAARTALSPAERAARGAAIDAALRALTGIPTAVLGLYWPINGEVDARPFAAARIAAGDTAALPVVTGPGEPLLFRRWQPGDALVAGAHGIPHPAAGEPLAPTTLLIPLLGFDAAGYRLGYGAGYYDRTLALAQPRPLTIGLGFELGRLPTIDPQPHDIPLDIIITETGAHVPPR